MKNKGIKYIKIENRGKVNVSLLQKTEEFIKFLCFDFQRGIFYKLSPKLFKVLKESELNQNEEFGFEFTVIFNIFKGRIEIRKQKDLDYFNIYFYKRRPAQGKFEYDLYITKIDISLDNLNKEFDFLIKGESQKIATGNVYLLKNGMVCIIKKYYSNVKIGVIYDEDSEDVEEYIRIEDIEKLIRVKN